MPYLPTPASSRPASVYFIIGFGVMMFSFSPILVRFAGAAPGETVAVWRTLFAVLMLSPAAFLRTRHTWRHFTRNDLLLITGSGILLGLHFVTWIGSIYHTTIASASVLLTTSPLFMALFGYLILREHLRRPVVLSIFVATGGAILIAWGDLLETGQAPNPLLGNSLALSAALFQCFYLLIGRIVRQKAGWLTYVYPLYTVAALTTLAVALFQQVPLTGYPWPVYGWCALMALGPQIIGHGSFNYAIKFFPAAILGLLGLTEPVGASIFAYFLFDERPTAITFGGMLLVLFAVSFALYKRRKGEGYGEETTRQE